MFFYFKIGTATFGDHGDVIVAWKWAQNTANNCKYCLSLSTSNKPIKLAQAPKKTKKQNQSHKTLASTKKRKKNPSIYSGFWTPIGWKSLFFLALFGACQCFVRLCFVFFCFFWCLPMSWEIKATKHWQEKNTTTRCTKLWQAPKKNPASTQDSGTP